MRGFMYPLILPDRVHTDGKKCATHEQARKVALDSLISFIHKKYDITPETFRDLITTGKVEIKVEARGIQAEERYYLRGKLIGFIHSIVIGDTIKFEAYGNPEHDDIEYESSWKEELKDVKMPDPTDLESGRILEEIIDEAKVSVQSEDIQEDKRGLLVDPNDVH